MFTMKVSVNMYQSSQLLNLWSRTFGSITKLSECIHANHVSRSKDVLKYPLLSFRQCRGLFTSSSLTSHSNKYTTKVENLTTEDTSCYVDASQKCPISQRHQHTLNPAKSDEVRVLSYNILCHQYTKTSLFKSYVSPNVPEYVFEKEYRNNKLLHEISGYKADLMCLQETGELLFNDVLSPTLSVQNYKGIYAGKQNNIAEGCATFYREDKFNFLGSKKYCLGEELSTRDSLQELFEHITANPIFCDHIITRPNILQVVLLQNKEHPSMIIVAASTHLHAKPSHHTTRILQTKICLTLLTDVCNIYSKECPNYDIGVIFCGDFNSIPGEPAHTLLTKSIFNEDDPSWSNNSDIPMSGIELTHNWNIESACGTPAYTNYVHGFNGCIDYIFFEKNKFSLAKSIPFPTHEEVSASGSIPNINFPSDHIALIADLKIFNKTN